ncbi:MAG: ATP-binding cassette domain-containing protein [Microthrixaceae bacterium]
MVRTLQRNGITIVVVEQSINVALGLAQRAVFMEKGTVRFEGPTADLLERPRPAPLGVPGGRRRGTSNGAGGTSDGADADGAAQQIAATDLAVPSNPSRSTLPLAERESRSSRSRTSPSTLAWSRRSRTSTSWSGPGEVGLIGQNGAGKTTLMDCISKVPPGRRWHHHLPRHRRHRGRPHSGRGRLGRSFQEARLFPSLTVSEVIVVACERTVANRSLVADATHQPGLYVSEEATAAKVGGLVEMPGVGTVCPHADRCSPPER